MSFYFSATPVFTPQTYEEMVKPLDKYNTAYEKVESQLMDLQDKTQYWADRVQDSPVAKQMYEYYNTKLQQLSDDFAKGMTSGNRAKLVEMHKDYSKTMGALENQWKAKEAFIKERKDKGNDYIYGVYDNPNYVEGGNEPAYLDEVNLDMFANGRTPTTRGLNLDDYQKKVSTDMMLIAGSAPDKLGKSIKTEDGQRILHNITSGELTKDDVDEIGKLVTGIVNGEEFDPKTEKEKIYYYYANNLVDHINNTPYRYMSDENKEKILHTTREGLLAGIQRNRSQLDANANFESDASRATRALQSAQFQLSKDAAEREKTTIANVLGLDAKNRARNNSEANAATVDGSKFYWKDENTIVKVTENNGTKTETFIDANTGTYYEDGEIHSIMASKSKKTSTENNVNLAYFNEDGSLNTGKISTLFGGMIKENQTFTMDDAVKKIREMTGLPESYAEEIMNTINGNYNIHVVSDNKEDETAPGKNLYYTLNH